MVKTTGDLQNDYSRPEEINYNIKRFSNSFKSKSGSLEVTEYSTTGYFKLNVSKLNLDVMAGTVKSLPSITYIYSENEDIETFSTQEFWSGDWIFNYETKEFITGTPEVIPSPTSGVELFLLKPNKTIDTLELRAYVYTDYEISVGFQYRVLGDLVWLDTTKQNVSEDTLVTETLNLLEDTEYEFRAYWEDI